LTHFDPFPPQSVSALHGFVVELGASLLLDVSPAVPESVDPPESAVEEPESAVLAPESLPVAASVVPESVPLEASVPASLPPRDTHCAVPFESLHTYPSGQPFTLQSPSSPPPSPYVL
jgi:hypothetical protein